MTTDETLALVKSNLDITGEDKDLIINDMINETLSYCNLTEVPDALEPFIRKKVKAIINYESVHGDTVFDVKSIKEGDTSISYNVDDKTSKDTIYGLSESDRKLLQRFRRMRR